MEMATANSVVGIEPRKPCAARIRFLLFHRTHVQIRGYLEGRTMLGTVILSAVLYAFEGATQAEIAFYAVYGPKLSAAKIPQAK